MINCKKNDNDDNDDNDNSDTNRRSMWQLRLRDGGRGS